MKKASWYSSTRVMCPFYKRETREMVCCNGIYKDNTLHIAFGNPSAKIEHKKTYCERKYQRCPLYQMLIAYEEREGS